MSDYIPPELIPNILARLPVDDVLRCTSVCKSWYSIITSPCFASSHFNLFSPNQEPRLFVTRYILSSVSNSVHRDSETFDEVAEMVSSFQPEFCIVDCLNGLVCLSDFCNETIVLWNPSLRKSFTLPTPRVLSEYNIVGFGLVPTSHEYKIIRLSYDDESESITSEAEIYELGTGSWRDLKLGSLKFSVESEMAHLKGIMYWTARNSGEVNSSNMILTFDLKSEKFGSLTIPSCLLYTDSSYSLRPRIFRESLCLESSFSARFIDKWAMKEYGVADSWEQLFRIDKEQHNPKYLHYFRHNGEFLCETFCKSSDDKPELVSYDHNNNKVKNLGLVASQYSLFKVCTYMESLVLMNGPK